MHGSVQHPCVDARLSASDALDHVVGHVHAVFETADTGLSGGVGSVDHTGFSHKELLVSAVRIVVRNVISFGPHLFFQITGFNIRIGGIPVHIVDAHIPRDLAYGGIHPSVVSRCIGTDQL
ncbi:hypothetical protein SDC9_194382 [bioreactor metagenome]|uniref:Uncharacterized protein n=1 Tax=bioreactor metagenome TaxID=1076179 RepID=A0A645IEQ3_9ZZZZ